MQVALGGHTPLRRKPQDSTCWEARVNVSSFDLVRLLMVFLSRSSVAATRKSQARDKAREKVWIQISVSTIHSATFCPFAVENKRATRDEAEQSLQFENTRRRDGSRPSTSSVIDSSTQACRTSHQAIASRPTRRPRARGSRSFNATMIA